MRLLNRWAVLVVFVGLLVTACGGSDDSSSSTTEAASGGSTTTEAASGGSTTTEAAVDEKPTTVDGILNYSGDDREEFLYACAQDEGKVVLYTSSSAGEGVEKPTFEAAYPGVTVEVFRETSDLPAILVEEELAGRHNFDMYGDLYGNINIDDEFFSTFYTPRRDELQDALNNDYFVGTRGFFMSVVYNTDLVSAEDAPASYEDLLDPKWEGQIFGSTDTSAAVTAHLIALDKGEDFLADLASAVQAQEGVSSAGIRDLVIAGQVPIGWNVSSSYYKRNTIDEGAPLMWVPMSPTTGIYSVNAISKNAPHPCAAALLMDFFLSEEGQVMYSDLGNSSPFKDSALLPYPPPGYEDFSTWDIKFNTNPDLIEGYDTYQDALQDWNQEFRNLFIRGG